MNRLFLVWIGVMAAGAFIGCGGDDTSGFGAGNGAGGAGGGALKNCGSLDPAPSGCGEFCDTASDCAPGTYCDELGVCAAQCVVRDDCKPGFSCNMRGICSRQCEQSEDCGPGYSCNSSGLCSNASGGTGGSSGTGATGGGNGCQSVQVTPSRSIPNVMFLVDQSGSMVEGFGGGEDRWEAAHSAINSIVSDIDSIVRFGLTTYTSRDGNRNPPCPRLPVAGDPLAASARIDFGLNNASAFGNTSIYPYRYPSDAGEDTPTGDSIDALVSLIQANPPPNQGPTIIVLATDGEPDSCEYPDPSNGSPEQTFSRNEVVTAAAAAKAAGIDVFVLWVGQLSSTSTRNHLQEVANAGVNGTGTVWVGDNPANLSNAFQSIISDSISCDVTMEERFDDKDKACAQGDVQLNGTPLSCPAQWRVKPGFDDVIELVGSACQTFKSGSSTFTAEFPCGAIVVE